MAKDLRVEFRELLRERQGINRRLTDLGITATQENIGWPETLEGQALLVKTLREGNGRLTAELNQLDQDTAALDCMLDNDTAFRGLHRRLFTASNSAGAMT